MSDIAVGGPPAGSGEIAISCDGVWKSYRNYHQRSHSLKEKVLATPEGAHYLVYDL